MRAPNTPMANPTTNRTVAVVIPERGLDAERDLTRLAATTPAFSVAADPFEPLPDLLVVGNVAAAPRIDCPAGAERTVDAVLRTGVPDSSHQPGPSQP